MKSLLNLQVSYNCKASAFPQAQLSGISLVFTKLCSLWVGSWTQDYKTATIPDRLGNLWLNQQGVYREGSWVTGFEVFQV